MLALHIYHIAQQSMGKFKKRQNVLHHSVSCYIHVSAARILVSDSQYKGSNIPSQSIQTKDEVEKVIFWLATGHLAIQRPITPGITVQLGDHLNTKTVCPSQY